MNDDTVIWRWERPRMRWMATLRDGTKLIVELQRFGRRSYWNPLVNGAPTHASGFSNPTDAQNDAFAFWKKNRRKGHR